MSTGRALSIASLAVNLLQAVAGHFQQAGVTLPDRRGVVPGEPRVIAWDCEQLTVSLAGIGWGQAVDLSSNSPAPGSQAGVMAVRHAVFAVTLVRCTPTRRDGKTPDMVDLDEAGVQFMRDAGLISQALVEHGSRVRSGLPPEGRVQMGAVEAVGPSGGFHGLESTMTVTASRLE